MFIASPSIWCEIFMKNKTHLISMIGSQSYHFVPIKTAFQNNIPVLLNFYIIVGLGSNVGIFMKSVHCTSI
ncbi:hypothetical protein EUGRSUZ_A00415 [Eucalyptus grandis]|uniref:Uncharacterized protein n=2 Tax=Eucalyptus grandis TaxID=71139 RepID=A0ACC3LZN2_EUCGR|nr:hypothetical protein EUGRSUZ_A00415 [Eucalyptus grandis]